MAWLFLGLATLPLAALLYTGYQRLVPHLLEPLPQAIVPRAAPANPRRAFLPRLTGRPLTAARLGLAVVVVGGIGVAVSRRPAAAPGGGSARSLAAAPEAQLPPPIPLQVKLHLGSAGAGDGQLQDPRDMAIDPAGNVYVADTGNKRVVKFNPDGSFALSWSDGPQGKFVEPSSLAIVKDGVIVDDSEAARLHKYDFNGKLVPEFDHDLGLSHPRGIAVAADGSIFVGDTGNSRVVKVKPDGSLGGNFDTKGVKLEQPSAVAFDDQGNVYSIEVAANRIQKFSADGTLQSSSFLPGGVTLYPPRGAWIPGRGLFVNLPDQNEALTYNALGLPETTFAPLPSDVSGLEHPSAVANSADDSGLWMLWGKNGVATLLAWPS